MRQILNVIMLAETFVYNYRANKTTLKSLLNSKIQHGANDIVSVSKSKSYTSILSNVC